VEGEGAAIRDEASHYYSAFEGIGRDMDGNAWVAVARPGSTDCNRYA
jgi:hypothetical protein